MNGKYVEFLETLASDWSSHRASSMVNKDLIEYIQPRFHRCSSPLKVRILLAMLYISEQKRTNCKDLLLKILSEAEVDKDDWVRKLSRLVSTFVSSGAVDVRDTDSETAFQILKHIRTCLNQEIVHKAPLESEDMVNIIGERFQDPMTDIEFGEKAAFGTTDFRPGLDLKKMTQDLCAHGEKALIQALRPDSGSQREAANNEGGTAASANVRLGLKESF